MIALSHLMWLSHILPAVALTITVPAPTTPSSAPLSGCSSENLIKDVGFESIDLDDSVWTVLPPNGGAALDGYLFVFAQPCIQAQVSCRVRTNSRFVIGIWVPKLSNRRPC